MNDRLSPHAIRESKNFKKSTKDADRRYDEL
jgi:hypothetical protein